ncbi:MAG TPA: DUF1015 domain-containing protein [Acidimicrobiales bacterium]|nr:DUF1015 domain-containing protein [Acidimicrobiales bacterium]
MPRFEAFRGVRYAPEVDLDAVVCPPYDVIGPEERAALVSRSPHNCVQIELPAAEPGGDRYAEAAHLYGLWQQEGVLRRDPEPTLYVSRMTFDDEAGRRRSGLGVLGALELGVPGQRDVLPHERTTPKPKSERLDLQRACRANISPVWGLSMASGLSELLAPGREPDGERLGQAVDTDGITHDLWRLPAERNRAVSELVSRRPVVLADGHHRYETGLAYQREVRAANGDKPGDHDLILTLVTELADDQISLRAIHRLVSGLPAGFDPLDALGRHFELTGAGPVDPAFLHEMERAGALGVVTPSGSWLAKPRPATEDRAEYPLDSARAAVALGDLPEHELVYQHGVENIAAAVDKGEAQLGILLRPATVSTIRSMAEQRLLMPPKTTFFYPKPRTGLVFRTIDLGPKDPGARR